MKKKVEIKNRRMFLIRMVANPIKDHAYVISLHCAGGSMRAEVKERYMFGNDMLEINHEFFFNAKEIKALEQEGLIKVTRLIRIHY